MSSKPLIPFTEGQFLPRANLTILAVLVVVQEGQKQILTRYRIRYACCDKKETLTHLQILQRGKRRAKLGGDPVVCVACGRERQRKTWQARREQREQEHNTPAPTSNRLIHDGWHIPPSKRP